VKVLREGTTQGTKPLFRENEMEGAREWGPSPEDARDTKREVEEFSCRRWTSAIERGGILNPPAESWARQGLSAPSTVSEKDRRRDCALNRESGRVEIARRILSGGRGRTGNTSLQDFAREFVTEEEIEQKQWTGPAVTPRKVGGLLQNGTK